MCLFCGQPFEAERQAARYCSDGCKRRAAYQRRSREINTPYDRNTEPVKIGWLVVCGYCGAVTTTTSPKTRYCGPACKQAAWRERSKERR